MENKLPKSQIAKITFLLLFFAPSLRIPFISPSMRFSYLYLLLNLLTVVLGAEAGFLAAILKPRQAHDVKKQPSLNVVDVAHDHTGTPTTTKITMVDSNEKKKISTVTTTATSNISTVESSLKLMKRCKSKPGLFFIGGSEEEELKEEEVVINYDNNNNNDDDDEIKRSREEGEVMSKQELFNKAEVFIGNVYNPTQDAEGTLLEEVAWDLSQGSN